MREIVEGPIHDVADPAHVKISGATRGGVRDRTGERPRLRIETVPCAREPLEAFDDRALPTGDVLDERLHDHRRAFSPPVEKRPRHIHTASAAIEIADQPRAEERADARDRPIVAGVNEGVFPQAVGAAARNGGLTGEDFDQRAQDMRLCGEAVFLQVNGRNPFPQFLGIVALKLVDPRVGDRKSVFGHNSSARGKQCVAWRCCRRRGPLKSRGIRLRPRRFQKALHCR